MTIPNPAGFGVPVIPGSIAGYNSPLMGGVPDVKMAWIWEMLDEDSKSDSQASGCPVHPFLNVFTRLRTPRVVPCLRAPLRVGRQ